MNLKKIIMPGILSLTLLGGLVDASNHRDRFPKKPKSSERSKKKQEESKTPPPQITCSYSGKTQFDSCRVKKYVRGSDGHYRHSYIISANVYNNSYTLCEGPIGVTLDWATNAGNISKSSGMEKAFNPDVITDLLKKLRELKDQNICLEIDENTNNE